MSDLGLNKKAVSDDNLAGKLAGDNPSNITNKSTETKVHYFVFEAHDKGDGCILKIWISENKYEQALALAKELVLEEDYGIDRLLESRVVNAGYYKKNPEGKLHLEEAQRDGNSLSCLDCLDYENPYYDKNNA